MSSCVHLCSSDPLFFDDEAPMTMQVGMIGADGIVIASDTMVTETVYSSRLPDGLREEYSGPKILIDRPKKMMISCALDITSAVAVARKVISNWSPEEDDEQASQLGKLVNPFRDKKSFECIVATSRPKLSLFRILYFYAHEDGRLFVTPVKDRICAGDHPNGAQFWHLRYYERARRVSELKNLAAQLIVDAAFLNSSSIGGLEIATLDESGEIERESDDRCREMEAEARARAAKINSLIFPPCP